MQPESTEPRVVYAITDEYAIVRVHGSSKLYLEWREKGRPVRRSTGHRELEPAKQRARELILEHADIRGADPSDASIVAILERHYLRYARNLASQDTYKASRKLWSKFFGTETIAELTPTRQRAFKTWLEGRGLSQGYVRRVIGDGKAALNHAWQEGEITRVPFVRLPPVSSGYPHWAKFEQLVRFLNTPMPDHLFTYCMLRLNTGCRGDAARDLQPFQVDWHAGLIALNPPGRIQTKKFRPVVPLTDFLGAYLRRQPAALYYVHWQGRRIASVRTTWRQVREEAGLPAWFAPKILRHTVGTELRRRGVPGWDLSGQLGHKKGESSPTTENYAKFDPTYLATAKLAFDNWMQELAAEVPRMRDASSMQGRAGMTGRGQLTAAESVADAAAETRATTGFQVVGGRRTTH